MNQDEANVMVLFILFWTIWTVVWSAINEHSSKPDNKGQSFASPGRALNQDVAERTRDGRLPSNGNGMCDSDVVRDLELIRRIDPGFDVRKFLDCACLVYETVIMAFANGDRELLRELLSPEVNDVFLEKISEREQREESVDLKIVCLAAADITSIAIFNKHPHITIVFEAQVVSVTRAKDGTVVSGDPVNIQNASDRWTFSRELNVKTPVWKIIATDSA